MHNLSYTVIYVACIYPPSSSYFFLISGQLNIIIDGDGCPRICDYGLAFIFEPSEFTSIKTAEACRWTALEIMNLPEDDCDSVALFTKESDIYAFGMTVLKVILDHMVS